MRTPFDRRLLRLRRDRVAHGSHDANFLIDEIRVRLVERLTEMKRSFSVVAELGCRRGELSQHLQQSSPIGTLVQTDLSFAMLTQAAGFRVVADEEFLPFGANTLDAVVSVFTLHWANDLPGCLAQIRYALKPQGLFLAAMAGGNTLHELRRSLTRAELEMTGGTSPRVAPFVDTREAAALLQRAGLKMPMADFDRITIRYSQPMKLLSDLQAMGETSVLSDRSPSTPPKQLMSRTLELYHETCADEDGLIPATFDIVFLTGWKS
ncbi:MAG: methyltransferase domain-containing protein [Pseudomonadota bacterium]